MSSFKFFSDNDDMFEEWDGASWTFVDASPENLQQYNYEIVQGRYTGIRGFLRQFPNNFIAGVVSLTGPNGFVHNIYTEDTGWGFNILYDEIDVVWVRFRE